MLLSFTSAAILVLLLRLVGSETETKFNAPIFDVMQDEVPLEQLAGSVELCMQTSLEDMFFPAYKE